MGDIKIGIIGELFPNCLTQAATDRLMERIEESKKGLEFHCERCGAARTGFFDPGHRAILNLTCENATAAQPCNIPPTPRPERDPAYYVPGSLVLVKILEGCQWPAIVEDDPLQRATYKRVTTDPEGREIVEAYFISLISPDGGPHVFFGGFYKPEDLSPFSPIELAPDCTDRYKSALENATKGLALDLGTRLRTLSFTGHPKAIPNAVVGSVPPLPLLSDMDLFSVFHAAEGEPPDVNQIPDHITEYVSGRLEELFPPYGLTEAQVMELALRDFPGVGPFFPGTQGVEPPAPRSPQPGTSGGSREQLRFQEFIGAHGLQTSEAGTRRGERLCEAPQDEPQDPKKKRRQ